MQRPARAILFAIAAIAVTAVQAPAEEYALVWNGPIDNGIAMRIPGFFVGSVGAGNMGVHLVVGDRSDWDSCTHRIDLGEIRRRGFDGEVDFDIGGLIEEPPFYAYFVRGGDHVVHATHEIFYTREDGRPVISIDTSGPGAPGQPRVVDPDQKRTNGSK